MATLPGISWKRSLALIWSKGRTAATAQAASTLEFGYAQHLLCFSSDFTCARLTHSATLVTAGVPVPLLAWRLERASPPGPVSQENECFLPPALDYYS